MIFLEVEIPKSSQASVLLCSLKAVSFLKEAERQPDSVKSLLRDLISIQSFSTHEEAVVGRLVQQAKELDADEILVDENGTFIARFGKGGRSLNYDSDVDTVDIGSRKEWSHDPFSRNRHFDRLEFNHYFAWDEKQ